MHSIIATALVLSVSAVALTASPPGPDAGRSDASCPPDRSQTGVVDSVYLEFQVDRPARPKRRNPEMAWPSGYDSRIGPTYTSRVRERSMGEVELRFVVDRDGCADMRTVTVVSTTDSAFTRVVVETLPRWRFDAAEKGGKRVSQMLQWKWVLHERTGARVPGTQ